MTTASESPLDTPNQCSVCGREVFPDPFQAWDDAPCLHCGHLSWFHRQDTGDCVILNLMANLDLENADLERVGELLIEATPAPHIVLNLSNVEFVSSTFLGRLLALQKRVDAAQGKLVLCGMNPVVREIFQVTKLESFFHFSDDVPSAGGSPG